MKNILEDLIRSGAYWPLLGIIGLTSILVMNWPTA